MPEMLYGAHFTIYYCYVLGFLCETVFELTFVLPVIGCGLQIATVFVGVMCFLLLSYTFHCTWVTSEAYSSPSIVLSARSHDGSRIIFDDFREAYYWLRMNTPEVGENTVARKTL